LGQLQAHLPDLALGQLQAHLPDLALGQLPAHLPDLALGQLQAHLPDLALGQLQAHLPDLALGQLPAHLPDLALGQLPAHLPDLALGQFPAHLPDLALGQLPAHLPDLALGQLQAHLPDLALGQVWAKGSQGYHIQACSRRERLVKMRHRGSDLAFSRDFLEPDEIKDLLHGSFCTGRMSADTRKQCASYLPGDTLGKQQTPFTCIDARPDLHRFTAYCCVQYGPACDVFADGAQGGRIHLSHLRKKRGENIAPPEGP
jgi:hypothetical protein